MSTSDPLLIAFDLEPIYRAFPKLSRDYYFVRGEDIGLITQVLTHTRWPLEPDEFSQYVDWTSDQIHDSWELQYFADESTMRYNSSGASYLNFYDYTRDLVTYICNQFQSLVPGSPYRSVEIRSAQTQLLHLGQLLLTVYNHASYFAHN